MNSDEVLHISHVVADADPLAMVVYSPLSYEPGGHVTVVHLPEQAEQIDQAILDHALFSERIDETRTKVYARLAGGNPPLFKGGH